MGTRGENTRNRSQKTKEKPKKSQLQFIARKSLMGSIHEGSHSMVRDPSSSCEMCDPLSSSHRTTKHLQTLHSVMAKLPVCLISSDLRLTVKVLPCVSPAKDAESPGSKFLLRNSWGSNKDKVFGPWHRNYNTSCSTVSQEKFYEW